MKSPAYHLRPNKSVDRFRLVEILKKLKAKEFDFSEYSYIGFGGPFLEDHRLMGDFFPEMSTVSIERDLQVCNRQEFHVPHKKVTIKNIPANEFINDYSAGTKCVFWLDYTNLKPSNFDEFKQIIEKVQQKSIVKITLRADLEDYPPEMLRGHLSPEKQTEEEQKFLDRFMARFGDWTPAGLTYSSFRSGRFFLVIEQMLQIAAQQVFPASADGLRFQILDSTHYSDTSHMFCLTGMVCTKEDSHKVKENLLGCKFSNLEWGNPQQIDVPILSTKERLHLERHLPMDLGTGEVLHQVLNYNIENTAEESIERLRQYSDFSRYLPYFVKAAP